MAVKPIPEGFHSVTPYLTVRGAAEAIDFYRRAFGAVELMRLPGPGGTITHAEVRIGDSIVMLADEAPEMGTRSPESLGGTGVSLYVYVEDVDAVVARAAGAGAKVTLPARDMFWGDRFASVVDPFGHVWGLATHQEDLSPDEIARRRAAVQGAG
jgi:PhnB protein